MKILTVGYYTEDTVKRIKQVFPENWELVVVRPGEEAEWISDADVLIPEHIQVNEELLKKAPKLKLVQTGAGYDNVDINACTRFGVKAANAAGVNAAAVAEHAFAMMLDYYKNISYLDNFMKQGGDEKQLYYNGAEMSGKTIGILGLGAIGKKLAGYCHAMGMEILGYDLFDTGCEAYVKRVSKEELLKASDVVSIHIYLNESTKHMFNRSVFEIMKKEALLVNTARGGIICQDDLIWALKTGEIGGACLDVFEQEPLPSDSELRNLTNVILTPHTAGMPDGLKFHKTRYMFFKENIERVMENRDVQSALN